MCSFKALPSFHHFWVVIAYVNDEDNTMKAKHYFPKNINYDVFIEKIGRLYELSVPAACGVELQSFLATLHEKIDSIVDCLGSFMTILEQAEARRIKTMLTRYSQNLRDEFQITMHISHDNGPLRKIGKWETLDHLVGSVIFQSMLNVVHVGDDHRDDIRIYIRKVSSGIIVRTRLRACADMSRIVLAGHSC